MNHPLLAASTMLTVLLERENAALAALDLTAAGAMVEPKRAATEDFAAAHARLAAAGGTLADDLHRSIQTSAARLHDLAQDNRRLLERALAVQGRVIGVLAQAAPRKASQAPRYGAAGTLVGAQSALPVALSASI